MEEDQKINMALDDIIRLQKKENDSLSHKSNGGFRSNGAWRKYTPMEQDAVGDANSIQNLRYSYRGPLALRNRKRYGIRQRNPVRNIAAAQYSRNRVRYATQVLNRAQLVQQHTQQRRPFSSLFIRNRLMALKRLQRMRAIQAKMAGRARSDSDTLSVVIPNEIAMKRRGLLRARRRGNSLLTVRNMRKFDALTGSSLRSLSGSIHSADYRSRRSRSASVGRNSRAGTPIRHYAGSLSGRNSRAGTPANSEASGYSVRNHSRRLLNYRVQRELAILQGRTVPVDQSGRPVIFCNGLGLDFVVTPAGTEKTLHERISEMLQNL